LSEETPPALQSDVPKCAYEFLRKHQARTRASNRLETIFATCALASFQWSLQNPMGPLSTGSFPLPQREWKVWRKFSNPLSQHSSRLFFQPDLRRLCFEMIGTTPLGGGLD